MDVGEEGGKLGDALTCFVAVGGQIAGRIGGVLASASSRDEGLFEREH